MREKLNNKKFLYRNLQIFYANCSDEICKECIKDFATEFLHDLYYNVSLQDLENLIKLRKKRDRTHKKKIDKNLYYQIKSLIKKDIEIFMFHSYEIFENVIYFKYKN